MIISAAHAKRRIRPSYAQGRHNVCQYSGSLAALDCRQTHLNRKRASCQHYHFTTE